MNLNDSQINKWKSLCLEDPLSTFYHTPEWYYTAQSYLSCSIELLTINEQAVLPTIKYRKGFRRRTVYESSPFGTYGGIIGDRSFDNDSLIQVLNGKRIFIRQNPYSVNSPIEDLHSSKKEFTQVINIPKNNDDLFSTWSSNHVRSLKKALNHSLHFELDQSPFRVERYYNLYKQSLTRWGSKKKNKHLKKLFISISENCSNHVFFYMVSKNKRDISGGIFFAWNNRIHYWSGASNEEGLKLSAPVFMFYKLIDHFSSTNYNLLDLNPSNNLEGVISFKSKFGSKALDCDIKSFGIS